MLDSFELRINEKTGEVHIFKQGNYLSICKKVNKFNTKFMRK